MKFSKPYPSKYKVDGGWKWLVEWRLDGKKHKKAGFDTKTEALEHYRSITAGLKGGVKKNVEWLIEEFLADKELSVRAGNLDPITFRYYANNLRRWVCEDPIAKQRVCDLDSAICQAFIKRLSVQAPRVTAQRVKAIFGMACKWGAIAKHLTSNPMNGLRIESTKRPDIQADAETFDDLQINSLTIPPPSVAKSIMEAADAHSLKAGVQMRLLFDGGLRPSEMLALRRISVNKCAVKITQRMSPLNAQPDRVKTEKSFRQIEVSSNTGQKIAEYLIQVPATAKMLFGGTRDGKNIWYSAWYRDTWCPVMKAAGLGKHVNGKWVCKYTPHMGRHFAVSSRIADGWGPKDIQEFVGHEDIRMTYNRYGHLFPKEESVNRSDAASKAWA